MFILMWSVMMLAMMLPSLTPVLLRLRRNGAALADAGRVAGAYFLVWTLFGTLAYPIGAALASVAMHHESISRAVPRLTCGALLLAGLVQWSRWKARHLACCCTATRIETNQPSGAGRAGLNLGVHCAQCCLAIMTFMLIAGSMELRVMLATTIIITAERVLPRPAIIARITGTAMILASSYLLFRGGI
jgi:predicted metal-binding membrane protein